VDDHINHINYSVMSHKYTFCAGIDLFILQICLCYSSTLQDKAKLFCIIFYMYIFVAFNFSKTSFRKHQGFKIQQNNIHE